MGPRVMHILSHQIELAARARRSTGDVNEASLLVGRVMCRALGRLEKSTSKAEISESLRRDLDRLIEQALRQRH